MADGTVVDIISFDTGTGLDVIQLGSGATATAVTTPDSEHNAKETYVCQLENGGGSLKNSFTSLLTHTASTKWWTLGFKIRFDDLTPVSYLICRILQTGGSDWELFVDSSGDGLLLKDSVGGTIGTASNVLTADTWHTIEIKWKKAASTDINLWVDGSDTPDITGSSKDLDHSNSTFTPEFQNDISIAYNLDIWFGTTYLKEDTGGAIDTNDTRLLDWTSFGATWAHSADITGGPADAPSPGAWTDTDDLPRNDTSKARYSCSGVETKTGGYSRTGPNVDGGTLIDNEMVGVLWHWRYETYGANKFGLTRPTFAPVYGFHGTATSDGTTTGAATIQTTGKRHLSVVQDKTGSQFPNDADDYLQIGMQAEREPFEADGNVDLYDCWTIILHKESAAGVLGLVNDRNLVNGFIVDGGLVG